MKLETLAALLMIVVAILLIALVLMMMYVVYVYSVQCWHNASMCLKPLNTLNSLN